MEQRKRQQFLMRQTINETQASWQEQQSRAKALRELEESGDGYQYGVKSVLEQKSRGKLQGILGTVSQLIRVPEHLEKAMEATMGVSLQNVITETDQQAQDAIRYLKEHRKGRATFLPLNTVRGQRAEDDLAGEEHVLGLAVDLISFEPQYEKIMLHLLGRVWVIENLASAVAIGKKHGFHHRMVTLDGELVTPGGALTGGNHDKDRGGLLARQRQITELEETVRKLADTLEEKNRELDAYYAETGKKKDAIAALRQDDQELIRRGAQLEQQADQQQREEARLRGELELEQLNLTEQQTHLEERQQELEAEKQKQTALAEEADRLDVRTEELKQLQQTLQQQQTELQELYNHDSVELATAQQRWELFSEQLRSEQQRYGTLQQTLQNRQREAGELEERSRRYQEDIERDTAQVQQETEQLAERNRTLDDFRTKRQELQDRIDGLEESVKQQRQQVEAQRDKKYQLDIQLNKVQGYLSGGYRRLSQNFELTYDEAKERAVPLENIGQAQKQIQQLKTELAALGEINFTAIEEYDQVVERLQFLQTQIGDLMQAKGSLNRVIAEMEKIMAQKFAETYREVNARFTEVFQSMFGGGQARLELSDPEDYLLTGIEIIAQPPGKKEQVLTLLSGGERAMTAIALLFSLLTVKPSPFCILDEIESALDDVNIDRFARFIREYAEKTQFIIISHRKGTMEAADVLYGVAMENKGVSRLMSVKVSDYV